MGLNCWAKIKQDFFSKIGPKNLDKNFGPKSGSIFGLV